MYTVRGKALKCWLCPMAPQTGEHRGNRRVGEKRLWWWSRGGWRDGSHHEVEAYTDFRLWHVVSWPLSVADSVLKPPLTTVLQLSNHMADDLTPACVRKINPKFPYSCAVLMFLLQLYYANGVTVTLCYCCWQQWLVKVVFEIWAVGCGGILALLRVHYQWYCWEFIISGYWYFFGFTLCSFCSSWW